MTDLSEDTPTLTEAQVAQMLNVSVRTAVRWRKADAGPKAYKLGPKTIRYMKSDVLAFIKTRAFAEGGS